MKTKFSGILTLLLAFVVQLTFAQEKTISGTVSDDSGLPLPGATVTVKGTSSGTSSDFDGKYSIRANQGATLVYSFIGYANREVVVKSSNTINITLQEDTQSLQEVVISVAYGNKKKKDIIGAISVLTAADIGDQKITTVTEALQGTSGVSLVNNSGQPGASPTIRIRGVGSLNGDSDPLIILDGAQFTGNLNAINFDDVAAYSVLKDADAVSLYGNRGANGVIIIKTKKGGDTAGKSIVSINSSFGFSDKATSDYSYLSAQGIMENTWLSTRNDLVDSGSSLTDANQQASSNLVNLLKANPFSISEPVGTDGKLKSNANLLYETDYLDALTQQATRQDVSLSVRGGTENTTYYASGSFLESTGYSLASKFKRASGRLNISTDVNDWLTLGGTTFASFSSSNAPIQDGSRFSNNIQYVRSVSSIYPIYQRNPNGSFILDDAGNKQYDFALDRGFFGQYNPVAETLGSPNLFERNTVNISPNVEVRFNDKLKFNSLFNFSLYLFEGNIFSFPFVGASPQSVIDDTSSQKERSTTKSFNVTNTLTYQQSFNEKHNLTLLAGQEMFNNDYNFLRTARNGFVFPELTELDNGNTATEARSYTNSNRLFSLFGRLDYNFNDIYYVGGSIRRDGSSRFIGDNKYGVFWSAAAGYSIYDQFFQDSNIVRTLKLRGSYGVVGNENIGQLFPYLSEFGTGFNIQGNGGVFPTSEGNPNLKWETHKKLNVGLDFGFFNDKINGSFEYYDNRVEDLIYLLVPQPSTGSGGDSENDLAPYVNIAELSNKGLELTLNSTNISTKDFRWTSTLVLFQNKNKIESIPEPELTGSFRWEEGRDRYEFYMREWAGVDPATGSPLWYKEVTDPTTEVVTKEVTNDYDEATRVYTGKSALPDFEGSFVNRFKYKNFDLALNFVFKAGGYIYNTDYASLMKARNPGEQLSSDVLSHWREPGDITDVPRQTLINDDFNSRSTRWLQEGDYVRLRNLSVGYSLDKSLMEQFSLKSARVYVSADNYFTWTKESRLDDPEQAFNGITDNRSTVMKTISLGVDISF
ncbi:SusC/RagA family TonB-linked outer membrane protein [Mariniflexile sp. AS56]|uniref:SusC/RagA family TonB-linked outer membrane protein n=1 Tax=Mariniflexile sp. AS56 TaxID=3063957 RepID=UPI0026EB3FDB|nr:TonB-dependent receptor [Mariniflexile sp. AS56]MDO7170752.1 TonB-dependent receptor [Mariniflexile sp. AS56]